MELKVTPWDKEEPPTEADLAEQLGEQELRVYHWSSPPEGMCAGHTHGYHKVVFVLEGSIEFEFPTRHQSIQLNAGDRLDLPAGLRHSAEVGLEGVQCMEAHIY